MFVGEYSHNIDAKGRIIMPSKLREQLGEQFMITRGFEGCLAVYPMEAWEKFVEKLTMLPTNQKSTRYLQRELLSGAAEAEPDKQGKVLITPSHRKYAELSKEVVIIGVGTRVEIWDAEKLAQYRGEETEMSLEEAAESLEGFNF